MKLPGAELVARLDQDLSLYDEVETGRAGNGQRGLAVLNTVHGKAESGLQTEEHLRREGRVDHIGTGRSHDIGVRAVGCGR
jgi:hypothetical protein